MDQDIKKKEIRSKLNEVDLKKLTDIQKTNTKIIDIVYDKFEIKKYLKSPSISNKEAEIIAALRSQTVRGIKNNFHTLYKTNLQCELCKINIDNQEHCITCPKIATIIPANKSHIRYEHVFGNVNEQGDMARLYLQLLKVREKLLREQQDQDQDSDNPPGGNKNTGPSTK